MKVAFTIFLIMGCMVCAWVLPAAFSDWLTKRKPNQPKGDNVIKGTPSANKVSKS